MSLKTPANPEETVPASETTTSADSRGRNRAERQGR